MTIQHFIFYLYEHVYSYSDYVVPAKCRSLIGTLRPVLVKTLNTYAYNLFGAHLKFDLYFVYIETRSEKNSARNIN